MDSNMPKNIDPYLNKTYERDSWKGMAQHFYTDVSHLIGKEGQLIRTEMNEKFSQIKVAVIAFAASGVILFAGFLCLVATAIFLLDLMAPLWLSSLIVAFVFFAIGGIMLTAAKKKLNTNNLRPSKSIEAFGEIRHSLKEKVHEITKH